MQRLIEYVELRYRVISESTIQFLSGAAEENLSGNQLVKFNTYKIFAHLY